jgi:hypothetical protein
MATDLTDARCATHVDQQATFVCARCGNFGCELCREQAHGERCGACLARLGPLGPGSGPVDFGQIVTEAVRLPLANWEQVLTIVGIQGVVGVVMGMVMAPALNSIEKLGQMAGLGQRSQNPDEIFQQILGPFIEQAKPMGGVFLLTTVVNILAIAALINLFNGALVRKPLTVGQMFGVGLSRLVPVFVTSMLYGFLVIIGFMLCCVPALPALTFFSLAVPLNALKHQGPVSSLTRSLELVRPVFWTVLGLEVVAWLALSIASSMGNVVASSLRLAGGMVGAGIGTGLQTVLVGVIGAMHYAMQVVLYHRLLEMEKLASGNSGIAQAGGRPA